MRHLILLAALPLALSACEGADAEDVYVNPDGAERIADLEQAVAERDETGGTDRYGVPTDTPPNEQAKYEQVGALVCPREKWLDLDDYEAGQLDPETEFDAWLLEEDVPEGIVRTESGLRYKVIQPGIERGYKPQKFDNVRVHYHGTFGDGRVFDSSYERGETIEFKPGQVIAGWTEALMDMAPCEARTLYIPAELAYGKRGKGDIPADTPLVFNVQILEVEG